MTAEKIAERLAIAQDALFAAEDAIGPARRKFAAARLAGLKSKVYEESCATLQIANGLVHGLTELLAEAKHADLGASIASFAKDRLALNDRLSDVQSQLSVIERQNMARGGFPTVGDDEGNAAYKRLRSQIHAGECERTDIDAMIATAEQSRNEIEARYPFIKAVP